MLAKHGLVVWGDSAREAYEQTVAVCNQAAEFANARAAGAARFGGPAAGGTPLDDAARRHTLHEVMPALRGAVSSERVKLLVADLSPAVCELVDSAGGAL